MLRCAQHDTSRGSFLWHAVKKTLSRVMLSESEASGLTNRTAWPSSDSSLPLRMTCPGHFLMACRKKRPRTCHAERQRSIWGDQLVSAAHVDSSLPLSMTRLGAFVMACHGSADLFDTMHHAKQLESVDEQVADRAGESWEQRRL